MDISMVIDGNVKFAMIETSTSLVRRLVLQFLFVEFDAMDTEKR